MNGRNVIRINGETASASALKELSSVLIDIHGQHEHQSLLYTAKHKEILDSYCGEELMELLGILVQQSLHEDNTISMPYLCYEALQQLGYQYPQDDCLLFMLRKPFKAHAEKICVYRLQPNNVDIDQVAQQAADFVLAQCGSEILAEKAELTIEEHLVNIVEHGLDEHDKENDYLVLKISIIGKNLKITIWDRGKEWLDESAITRTEAESILDMRNEEVSGSGRGLSIIKKIVSTISRQRHCGLNETIFFIPIEEGSTMEEEAS